MDPYAILGIEPTEDWSVIKKAYKKMAADTHPDKMGHARYFMMVHEAYQDLSKLYTPRKHVNTRENIDSIIGKQNGKPCREEDFNEYYKNHEIKITNPFEKGYKQYMSKSKIREDADQLVNAKVKRVEKRIVRKHEPESISNNKKWLEQVGLLGVDHIEDFTCSSGTDYMLAYQEPEEVVEKHRYYNSIKELEDERSRMSCKLSEEERKKLQFIEKEKLRTEQLRRQNLKKSDNSTYDLYRRIHNLLK